MKNKYLFLSVILLFTMLNVFQKEAEAVVAYPFPIGYRQPDGVMITITLKGDEWLSWAETTDGYALLSNGKKGWEYAVKNAEDDLVCSGRLAHNPGNRKVEEMSFLLGIPKKNHFSRAQVDAARLTLKNASSVTAFNPNGQKKLIMILIQFTDKAFTKTEADFNGLMNGTGYNLNGAEGSVKDYFLEMSYGNFELTTDIAPHIYTADHDMAYYGAHDGTDHDIRANELMKEAVLKADADGVDFSQYDNDGDGSVDGVYIIYAGYGEATSGIDETIWPHAGGISGISCDGKTIPKYSCSNELNYPDNSVTTIGVICHEFGHICGAPDYYDTDYETGGQFDGTSTWDLMATGVYNKTISGGPGGSKPAHFNPMEKIRAGWVTPVVLSAPTNLVIPDVTTNPAVYIYHTTTSNEYFLLENRQKNGFNAGCKGNGLMIYHYSKTVWDASANKTAPQGLYPVCASAATNPTTTSDKTSYGSINSAGCPFPGSSAKTSFTDATTPWAKSWAGNNTNGDLENITESGGVISLCFKGCPAVNPVLNLVGAPHSGSQIDLSWIKNVANNEVILAWNSANTFGDPVNGTTYNVNDALSGGGTILYKGPASSFSHTGLSANTTYYYKIWSMTATPDYSTGTFANAQTLCASVTALPHFEGFEGGAIPGCWTQSNVIGTNPWTITISGTNGHPASPHGGTYLARCRTLISNAGYITKLISPPIDLSGNPNPVLKFWHTQETWNNQDILRVYYRTSGNSPWTQLAIYTSPTTEWTIETVALPNPSASYFIAFDATVNAGYGVCIDNVEIQSSDCGVDGTWTGTASNDWFNPDNWCGSVPGLGSDVIIPSGTPFSPTIAASGAVCRNITINSGATLTMNASTAYTLKVYGNWINNGNFARGIGIVSFDNQTVDQTIGGSAQTDFYTLRLNKGTQSKILEATSIISLNAISTNLVLVGGTLKISSASTITPLTSTILSIGISCGIWNNGATINPTGTQCNLTGKFVNSAGNVNFLYLFPIGSSNNLTIEGGNVNVSAYFKPWALATDIVNFSQSGGTLTFNSSGTTIPFIINEGSVFTMSGGNIIIQKASSASVDYQNLASTFNVTGGTLQIGNASTPVSQTIRINSTAPIYNLVVNATNSPIAQLVTTGLTVKNDVTISGGTLNANNLALNIGGNWTNNGTFTPGTAMVTFDGTVNQTLMSGGTGTGKVFSNLTLNNPAGVILSSNDVSISALALSQGVITTGNNKVIIPASGSVVRTSGHVFGNLQKNVGSGSNVVRLFEIGDANEANYAPLTVTFASVTTPGNLTARTVSDDHSAISGSYLNPSKSVNRNWTLNNSGTGFTTYDAVFTFLAGDLDGSVNTAALYAGNYASSVWTYPSTGTKTPTSLQITSVTSFNDFQLAESIMTGKISLSAGGNWSNPVTWFPSGVPVATDDVTIASPGTVVVDVDNAVCKDLTVQGEAELRINPSQALTALGNLSNSGTFTIESSSTTNSGSLIVEGTSSGIVKYNSHTDDNQFYIISSPVSGQSLSGFITAPGSGLVYSSPSLYGITRYEEPSNDWANWYTPATLPAGNMIPGAGYLMIRDAGSTAPISFTGALNGDVTISLTSTGQKFGWNSVGNPFTSSLNIKGSGSGENFLDVNTVTYDVLEDEYQAVYLWNDDASTPNYQTINKSGYVNYDNLGSLPDEVIQGGQGFLVNIKAPPAGTPSISRTLHFNKGTTGMQLHSATTTLKNATPGWPGVTLLARQGGVSGSTVITFHENMTSGLDEGYDAGLLPSGELDLYTRLVAGGETDFTIQALPEGIYNQVVVPVGLDLSKGGSVTFSAIGTVLPGGLSPFLEDRKLQIFTPLTTASDHYTVTLDHNAASTGRFYLHFGTATPASLNKSSILHTAWYADQKIIIEGSPGKGEKVQLFDVNGRKLGEYFLLMNSRNEIPAAHLVRGVYLLHLTGGDAHQVIKVPVAKY